MSEEQLTPEQIMEGIDPFGNEAPAQALEDFPDNVRADVEGLMWLGYLEDSFDFCGHRFTIRTLRGDEELLASLVCKEFVESLGQARAWVWAQIAMALVSVDGDTNFCPPVGHNKRDYARARFQYCTGKWFWPLASYINTRYSALIDRQLEAVKRVEDLYNGNPLTYTPYVGSLTNKGDSEDPEPSPPQEDIREYLDQPDSTDSKSDS